MNAGAELALAAEQSAWTHQQLAALAHLGVERASEADLQVFLHVCQRTGLDPFARQIYMIQRSGRQVIQAGIDGLRLVAHRTAERTGQALSISEPLWCGPEGQWCDVWVQDGPPTAARHIVTRGSGTFTATALWGEYVQLDNRGQVVPIWRTRPAGMLAKCAEALALRKAFPQDLAGLAAAEEAGVGPVVRVARQRPVSTTDVLRSGQGWRPLSEPLESQRVDELTGEVLEQAEVLEGSDVQPAGAAPAPAGAAAGQPRVAPQQRAALFAAFSAAGFTTDARSPDGRAARLAYLSQLVGRPVESTNDLSAAEASTALDALRADVTGAQ